MREREGGGVVMVDVGSILQMLQNVIYLPLQETKGNLRNWPWWTVNKLSSATSSTGCIQKPFGEKGTGLRLEMYVRRWGIAIRF